MSRVSKLAAAALELTAGLFAAGCQTGTKPAQSSLAETPQSVECTKCDVTWVKVSVTQGGRPGGQVVGYSKQKRDACPDCKGAVESVLTGGGFAHSCKACGGNMEVCKNH